MKFSRQSYLKKKLEVTETFNVTLPSGAEFTLRRPNLKAYLSSGQLPTSLLKKMMQLSKRSKAYATEAMQEMTEEETVSMLVYQGSVLREVCVSPRIVDNPQADDEISFTELADEDIEFITKWAFNAETGGVEGENVAQFRNESQQPIDVGADVTTLRRKTVSAI